MAKVVYSVSDVCKATGWSADKIRSLIHRGAIKAVNSNPGGRKPTWAILASELDRFLGADPGKPERRPKTKRLDDGLPDVFG